MMFVQPLTVRRGLQWRPVPLAASLLRRPPLTAQQQHPAAGAPHRGGRSPTAAAPAAQLARRGLLLAAPRGAYHSSRQGGDSVDTDDSRHHPVLLWLQRAMGLGCMALVAVALLLQSQPPAAYASQPPPPPPSSFSSSSPPQLSRAFVVAAAPTSAAGALLASPSPVAEGASAADEKLFEFMRKTEGWLDWTLGSAAGRAPPASSAATAAAAAAISPVNEQAHTLINEVWEVVDTYYTDVRGTGWDQNQWRALRDEALSKTYSSKDDAYRVVRGMIARSLSDPYSRFVLPSEMGSMARYDITGVGLNLGTAEEFLRKTGRPLPEHSTSPSVAAGAASSSSSSSSKKGTPTAREEQRQGSGSSSGGSGSRDGGSEGGSGGGVWVVGISHGSPSERAGIEQGDQLISIDGLPLRDLSPFQAAALFHGPTAAVATAPSGGDGALSPAASLAAAAADSAAQPVASPPEVQLLVRKYDDGRLVGLSFPRPAAPKASSPVSYRLEQRDNGLPVGVIRLTSFNARAQSDVSAAIVSLEAQGAQAYLLDLRDNRGGLVSEGLEVARLFLSGGVPIVVTQSRTIPPDPPRALGPPLTTKPLIVLVNERTASASEILAGALQDNCRAVLVGGGRTFGKGLIQSVYELSDGSGLVVTVGKYLTPRRTDIDRSGIQPDFRAVPKIAAVGERLDACRVAPTPDGSGVGAAGAPAPALPLARL